MAPSATETLSCYGPVKIQPQRQPCTGENPYHGEFSHVSNGTETGRILTMETLGRRVKGIDTDICEAGEEDAFFVADMGEVYRQHLRWKLLLNRVKPHYGKS